MKLPLFVELLALQLTVAFSLRLLKRNRNVLFEDGDQLIAVDNVALFHPPTS